MPVDYIPNCGSQLERAIAALFLAGRHGNWTANTGAARHAAILAALESAFAAKNSLQAADILLTNDNRPRVNPLTDIFAVSSTEIPDNTGTEIWRVTISNQFDAAAQPGQVNKGQNRVEIDTRVGKQLRLLLQSENGSYLDVTAKDITDAGRALASIGKAQEQANNVDMLEFTCLFVRFLGSKRGFPSDGEGNLQRAYWTEMREFEITAACAAVDGYSNDSGQ